MDALQRRGFTVLADRLDTAGFRQECANDLLISLAVQAEIVEGIGMLARDDRIGLGG